MAIGTAGYTAMLCVLALEDAGVTAAKGPVVVTGASGGVGSWRSPLWPNWASVIASTGRHEEEPICTIWAPTRSSPRANWRRSPRRLRRSVGPVRSTASARRRSQMFIAADPVWRRGCGLRTGPGTRSADERRTLHPAGHLASGNRIRLMPMPRRQQAWDTPGTAISM